MLNFTVGPSRAEQQRERESRAEAVRNCRDWAVRFLQGALDPGINSADELTLSVLELKCLEPGCPPMETCFAVLNEGIDCKFKVLKALLEVTEADVAFSVAAWSRGEAPDCNCGQFALPSIQREHAEAENVAEMKASMRPVPTSAEEEIDVMLMDLSSGTM